MAWYIVEVNGWDHLEQLLNSLGAPGLFYRGQADSEWGLTDSLTRHLGHETPVQKALDIETVAQKKFVEQAHFFLDPHTLPSKSSISNWWPLMQHFGAPTRLLDWTVSPYVAAYFAVVDKPHKTGAIWAFPESELRTASLEVYGKYTLKMPNDSNESVFHSVDSPELLFPTEYGEYPNIRMITQQGRFTLPGRILSDHGGLISKLLEGRLSRKNMRLDISAKAKPDILKKLIQLNITANTLFPGLDGLGKSIKEYVSST